MVVYQSFSDAYRGRLAYAEHPFWGKYPVETVAEAHGIVFGEHRIAVVGPRLRQSVADLLRHLAEIEIEILGVVR